MRARLSAAATLAIALLLAAACALLVWRVHAGLLGGLDTAVTREATAIAAAIEATGQVQVPVVVGQAFTVQVVDPGGTVLGASSDVEGEPRLFGGAAPPPGAPPTVVTGPAPALDSGIFRVAVVRAGANAVYVALPMDPVYRGTRQLVTAVAIGAPALLAALIALTWLLAGRALHPVEVLRRQAAGIDAAVAELSHRVDVPPTDDELSRLAVTLNDLLSRLEESQRQQRQFLADAAHELRSPVAAIRAQLETAEIGDDAGRALVEESARLSRLVDDLLSLARLDTRPPVRREDVDLDDVVRAEARSLSQRSDLAVSTRDVAPVRVVGDEGLLSRAVRNLLDNAARHAASRIDVSLCADQGTAVVTVADDGPGIPEADRARVFGRFTRLDGDRARGMGGVGLGLAIVHDVVSAHGGTVTIGDNSPGARLVVRLPSVVTPEGLSAQGGGG